jgi:hypothetical protein
MHAKGIRGGLAVISAAALVLAGCSSTGTSSTTAGKSGSSGSTAQSPAANSSGSSTAAPTCQVKQIGTLTRCENFYTAFWPVMKAKMAGLYQQAKSTNGGKIVIWGWYPVDQATQAAFLKAYPGLKIETKGLQYNIASSVVAAHATGGETSDTLGGAWTVGSQLLSQGYNDKIDWTQYGVPSQWLTAGVPWFPWSTNGWTIQYNKSKVSSPPTDLKDYLDPKWHGKLAMNPQFLSFFAIYGMKQGQSAMVDLIKKLKSSGNLIFTNNPQSMLATGDVSIVFDAQGYSTDPNIGVAPFQDSELWDNFDGVNTYGANKPGAILYNLWNAFDPDWLKVRTTSPQFASSSVPYPGLPDSLLDGMSGPLKANLEVWMSELDKGWAVYDTQDNAKQIEALQTAARNAGK